MTRIHPAYRSPFRFARANGMTLIELVIAIAIFALLGVMSWRAVSSMVDSRDRTEAHFARSQAITRVMQLIENDLTQLAPRRQTAGTSAAALRITEDARGELRLTRQDGANGNLQRRAYWLDGDSLVLARFPNLDDTAKPQEDRLLDRVKALRWRTLNRDTVGASPSAESAQINDLPDGIYMELELADAGLVTRIFALR